MLLGLRPESIRLADAGLPASVVALEYLGADSILLCEAAGQRLSVRAAGSCGVTAGTDVHLTWDAADQHLFDVRGRRIDTAVPGRPA